MAIINDLIRSQEDSHRVRQSTVRKIVHESAIYRLSVVPYALHHSQRMSGVRMKCFMLAFSDMQFQTPKHSASPMCVRVSLGGL